MTNCGRKFGCLLKGCAILLAIWYVWALYVAKFDPWDEQNRYDGRLEDAIAATGFKVGDFGDGCTLSAEVPVGDIAVSVQITYDGPHRPMIFPWRPYNKICIWSTAACRLDKDYVPLSDWAERRNREARIGKWSVAHSDFSKFPVSMSVGTDAWIDWTPEQLGAAIRGVAEESAAAIRQFGKKFPDDGK